MGGAKKEGFQDASIRRFRDQPLELVTAVGTSKPTGQLDSHQKTPGSKNERIGEATDVSLSPTWHTRRYPTARLSVPLIHVDRWRRLSLVGWGSERTGE